MLACFILFFHYVTSQNPGDEFLGMEIFSTRTPYFWTRDKVIQEPDEGLPFNSTYKCPVVYVDALIRHGGRNPALEWIIRFKELHSKLSNKGNTKIDNWINRFPESEADQLSALGKDEQFELGLKFGKRFESLFKNKIHRIKSISSQMDRAIDSYTNFSRGIAKALGSNNSIATVQNKTMIRFYKYCDKWTIRVKTNKSARMEYFKFKDGGELADICRNVQRRLMIDLSLDSNEVETMRQICAFELGLYNTSEWCAYFSKEELEALDYWFDIETYEESGYAYPINYEMSCPLIKDIFLKIDMAVKNMNQTYTVGTFRFGHSHTVPTVYTSLGLFKDEHPPRSDNYARQKHRKFKTSKILPFSANIAFVIYRCSDEYFIKVLVNEEEVEIPACNSTVCPLSVVRQYLSDDIDNCDVEERCRVDTGDSMPYSSMMSGLVFFVVNTYVFIKMFTRYVAS